VLKPFTTPTPSVAGPNRNVPSRPCHCSLSARCAPVDLIVGLSLDEMRRDRSATQYEERKGRRMVRRGPGNKSCQQLCRITGPGAKSPAAAEYGGTLIPPLRSRNTLQKRNQSASGVTKADAALRQVLRILPMLDARPEFINAAPSLCQQAKRRVAGRVLR
jgi:hypothetical protein